MDLRQSLGTIAKLNSSYTFALAPPALPIDFSEPSAISYSGSRSECLDIGDLTDDFKVHLALGPDA